MIKVPEPDVLDSPSPFSDKVYVLATVLDPQFAMHFVDLDVSVGVADSAALAKLRADLKSRLEGRYTNNARYCHYRVVCVLYFRCVE